MGLPAIKAAAVRRVVRHGHEFICGLCRRAYSNPGEATGCVDACWHDLLESDPVVVRRRGAGTVFRCRFCARDYRQHAAAARCADDCRIQHMQDYQREQSLAGVIPEIPRRPLAVLRPRAQPVRWAPRRPAPKGTQPVEDTPTGTAVDTPATINADVSTSDQKAEADD